MIQGRNLKSAIEMEHEHQLTAAGHSKMDHSNHSMNVPMGMPGHDHHKMMIEDFRKRFWVSILITIPVLLLSKMIQEFFGFSFQFAGDKYLPSLWRVS